MSEWSKEHAWKVCMPQKGIKGSNPFLSAKILGLSSDLISLFYVYLTSFVIINFPKYYPKHQNITKSTLSLSKG